MTVDFKVHHELAGPVTTRPGNVIIGGTCLAGFVAEELRKFKDAVRRVDERASVADLTVRLSACGTWATVTGLDAVEASCDLDDEEYEDVPHGFCELTLIDTRGEDGHRREWDVGAYLSAMGGQDVTVELDLSVDLPDPPYRPAHARIVRTCAGWADHAGKWHEPGEDVVVDRDTFLRLQFGGRISNTDPAFAGGWDAARSAPPEGLPE